MKSSLFELHKLRKQVSRELYTNYSSNLPRPKNKIDRAIDGIIKDNVREFDLSLILSGRNVLARKAADDLYKNIMKETSRKLPDINKQLVNKRWKELLIFWRQSLLSFINRLKLTTGG